MLNTQNVFFRLSGPMVKTEARLPVSIPCKERRQRSRGPVSTLTRRSMTRLICHKASPHLHHRPLSTTRNSWQLPAHRHFHHRHLWMSPLSSELSGFSFGQCRLVSLTMTGACLSHPATWSLFEGACWLLFFIFINCKIRRTHTKTRKT